MKNRKQFIYFKIFILVFVTSINFSCTTQKKIADKKQPNLLIILVDQWRAQATGYEGKEPVMTPHLDKYAKESLVMEQMVSNYPVCSPARAMLMTGQWPVKNKVYSNVNSSSAPFGIELDKNAVTWSDILTVTLENGI